MQGHRRIAASLLVAAGLGLAESTPPLLVGGSESTRITNVSGKAIRAISFAAPGKPLRAESLAIYGLKDGKLFEPGTMRDAGVRISDGESGYQIDYVYFSDGSGWGPDTLNKKNYIAGFVAGSRAMRSNQ